MYYVNNVQYDHLDEALEVADATGDTVMLGENNIYRIPCEARESVLVRYPANAVTSDHEAYAEWEKSKPNELHSGKTLFNGQTLLYEADRLLEVAAIRGVVTFEEFAKFHRRLIPLLNELGISLEDAEDERKARLESMAEG